MARLVVIAKGTPGTTHELNGHWTTVGRADGNMIQIIEPSISGRHCEVMVNGEELMIRDLLSTNGTFVGGKQVSEGVLKPGHTMRLGEVELRFECPATTVVTGVPFTNTMLLKDHVAASLKTEMILAKPTQGNHPLPQDTELRNESAKKYSALFVDDSMAFLESFTGICRELANHTWEILTATSADRALELLQVHQVDLVVLDVGIPTIDGIQLLGIINRRYPGLKIAVMTGHATEGNRAACLTNGAELFIEKPICIDGVKVVFNLLNDVMSWADRDGFRGALRQVGLQEIIQMECIGRRSSIFEIRNSQARGQIYIETGAIIHAAVGTLTGEQAFFRLLSLKGGEFQMKPFTAPQERTIHGGWELLVMEAARISDEETSFFENRAKASVVPVVPLTVVKAEPVIEKTAPAPEPVKLEPVQEKTAAEPEDEFVVVAEYDGHWSSVEASNG